MKLPIATPTERAALDPVAKDRRFDLVSLAALTFAAFLVRIYYWNLAPQGDETAAYLMYCVDRAHPIRDFLCHYSLPNHHGLHGLAVVTLYSLTGWGLPLLRLPAFVAGVLAVPLTSLCLRGWIGRRAAFLAACGILGSVWEIYYSVNARGYTMSICLILLVLHFLGGEEITSSRRRHALAGAIMAAAAYTNHVCIYFLAALLFYYGYLLIGQWRTGASIRPLTGCALIFLTACLFTTLFLFAPIILTGDWRRVISNRFVSPLPFTEFRLGFPAHVSRVADMLAEGVIHPILLLAGMVISLRQRDRRMVLLFAVFAVLPPIWLMQGVLPFLRSLTYLLPLAYGLAAVAILSVYEPVLEWLRRGIPRVAAAVPALCAAIAIMVLGNTLLARPTDPEPRYEHNSDIRPALLAVERLTQREEVIFTQTSIEPLLRYHLRSVQRGDQQIRYPRPGIANSVLVCRPRWLASQQGRAAIAGYALREKLYDDGRVRIIRLQVRKHQ